MKGLKKELADTEAPLLQKKNRHKAHCLSGQARKARSSCT